MHVNNKDLNQPVLPGSLIRVFGFGRYIHVGRDCGWRRLLVLLRGCAAYIPLFKEHSVGFDLNGFI